MYEQSSRNTVAFNSATHGGDGLFLWAGQSTMDTGRGGSNDNVFFGNDFSHAVANGIEATFSKNQFYRNRMEECWHGVWAGYSYDTVFRDNTFSGNDEGIAIEHGQNITIADNTFTGDQVGVRVWANASQDPNWGLPKNRDTRSREYLIQQKHVQQRQDRHRGHADRERARDGQCVPEYGGSAATRRRSVGSSVRTTGGARRRCRRMPKWRDVPARSTRCYRPDRFADVRRSSSTSGDRTISDHPRCGRWGNQRIGR
jgi:parallel beta-helix repeat protein